MMQAKMNGLLLKYHRLRLGFSQKKLCEGICVTSYLSKIENGQAEANDELIQALFARLGIQYDRDELFLNELELKLTQFFKNLLYNRQDENLLADLEKDEPRILSGPLLIDYLLCKALSQRNEPSDNNNLSEPSFPELNSLLSSLEPFMSQEELGWLALLRSRKAIEGADKAPLNETEALYEASKALHFLHNSYSALHLMRLRLYFGRYAEMIELYQDLLNMAINEGNVYALAMSNIYMGNVYSAQGSVDLMLLYNERAKNLLQDTKEQNTRNMIDYNIGATYCEQGEYAKALQYLTKLRFPQADLNNRFLQAHKLAIVYVELGEKKKAEASLALARRLLKQKDLGRSYHLMLEIIALRLEADYMDKAEYGSCLEALLRLLEHEAPKGFWLFNRHFLEDWYCYQRQYKKAYALCKSAQRLR